MARVSGYQLPEGESKPEGGLVGKEGLNDSGMLLTLKRRAKKSKSAPLFMQ